VSGLLVDQAEVAEGWLHLWQHTGDTRWRDAATRALTWARQHLGAPDGGAFDAAGGPGLLRHRRRPLQGNATYAEACWRLGALSGERDWLTTARAAADAALAEGEAWGFMAANAAAIAERLDRPAIVVKVWRGDALLQSVLADAHANVLGLALDAPEAERLGLQPGHAMACTPAACARPTGDTAELRRAIQQLGG
jgi:uncharacterized protein YyaL (SSP411 family)